MTQTPWPICRSRSQTCEPINPAPPVTKKFITVTKSGIAALGNDADARNPSLNREIRRNEAVATKRHKKGQKIRELGFEQKACKVTKLLLVQRELWDPYFLIGVEHPNILPPSSVESFCASLCLFVVILSMA